jgi:hypothetical protein
MRHGPLAYILTASSIGFAIPILFRLFSVALEALPSMPDAAWVAFDIVQLMFWPTPMLLTSIEEPGAADLSAWGTFAVTTLANVTLYGGLGGLIWVGVARWRWFLSVPAILIVGLWYLAWRT